MSEEIDEMVRRLGQLQHDLKLLKHRTNDVDVPLSDSTDSDDEAPTALSPGAPPVMQEA